MQVLSQSIVRSTVQKISRFRQHLVHYKPSAKLLLINTGTCCILYTAGDIFRQKIENHDINWCRTLRMGILGLCLGPIDHFWYTILDKFLPAATAINVGRKVLLDQLIMAPICCSSFFLGMSAMEGHSRKQCIDELQQKFWPTYKMDWKIWPAAQIFNFLFIPTQYRVAYVASVTFLWTIYLSYMKHKKMPSNFTQDTVIPIH